MTVKNNRFFYFIWLTLLFFLSCEKSNTTDPKAENDCISRDSIQYLKLSTTDQATIISLFKNNNLDYTDIKIFYYLNDFSNQHTTIVDADQYANGLRLYRNTLSYTFINGILRDPAPKRDTVNQSNIPILTLEQVRTLFINATLKDSYQNNKSFKDSCLVAELGYYDIYYGTNTKSKFVKVWETKSQGSIPIVFIEDDNGIVLNYINGK